MCIEGVHPHPRRAIEWGKDGNDNSAQVAEGRKPAQPSIPEGILGFPPPDAVVQGTPKTKAK
jgi:hypothetical protein